MVSWRNLAVFGGPLLTNELLLSPEDHAALLVWLDAREEAGFAGIDPDFAGFDPTPSFYASFEATTPPVCWKCGGSGYHEQWSHIAAGVCFPCNGTGRAWPRKIPPTTRGQKPWTLATPQHDVETIDYIKHWLQWDWTNPQHVSAIHYADPAATEASFEKDRWFQVGTSVAFLVRSADPTLYARSVRRAFQIAGQSRQKIIALKTLVETLGGELGSIARIWNVPAALRAGFGSVPGLYAGIEVA
jgi:hypothetical protein